MKSPQRIFSRKKSPCVGSETQGTAADRRAHVPAARRPVLLGYLDAWREAAADVEASSRTWRAVPAGDRADAALAFFAALDREEKAASAYQMAWEV